MKNVVIFAMLIALLGQMSMRTIIVVRYHIDKTQYLQHCENRAKPELKCDGKCHLRKELKSLEQTGSSEKAPQLPQHFNDLSDLLLFFQPENPVRPYQACGVNAKRLGFPPFAFHLPTAPYRALLKPPIA